MNKKNDGCINIIVKKLRSVSGESIGEALVSLLIAMLSLSILAGAVTTSIKLNVNTRKKDDALNIAWKESQLRQGDISTGTIKLTREGSIDETYDVSIYEDKEGSLKLYEFWLPKTRP